VSFHADEIERRFRLECGRAVVTLVRCFGDIDIAEEAVQGPSRWPSIAGR
jgi:predicted RNA polymerase sigma factor